MTVTNETDVYYDPYDVGIIADPYPVYARLREEAPIYYNERFDFWAISRHSDVERALANWEVFSNRRSDILELIKSKFDMPGGVMMFQDPPEHTRLRGLMSRVFTPRRMAEVEDQIRRYCVRCLDPLVGSGGFDIIAELASMMPMRVIGMLLGIPESEQISVRDANDANLRTKPGAPLKVANADSIADGRIYADYVEWRSKNPSDDLMTTLLNVEFDDEHGVHRKLTRKEVLTERAVAEALARTASQLRADAECLDDLAFAESGQLRGDCSDPAGLDAQYLKELPTAIRTRVLRDAAIMAGCPPGALTAGHVERIAELVTGWHGQRWVDLPGGVRARRRDGKVWFTSTEAGNPRGGEE